MKAPIPLITILLSVAVIGCGSQEDNPPGAAGIDRTDPEAVQVAIVTAILDQDYDTVEELVLPEQFEMARTMRQAAELAPGSPEVNMVDVTATVVEQREAIAIVDYSGDYCLDETNTQVQVTTVGPDGVETRPGPTLTEPAQCFDLADIFDTDGIELKLIDGQWHAPLPA